MSEDTLQIGEHRFASRLLVGTGPAAAPHLLMELSASGEHEVADDRTADGDALTLDHQLLALVRPVGDQQLGATKPSLGGFLVHEDRGEAFVRHAATSSFRISAIARA